MAQVAEKAAKTLMALGKAEDAAPAPAQGPSGSLAPHHVTKMLEVSNALKAAVAQHDEMCKALGCVAKDQNEAGAEGVEMAAKQPSAATAPAVESTIDAAVEKALAPLRVQLAKANVDLAAAKSAIAKMAKSTPVSKSGRDDSDPTTVAKSASEPGLSMDLTKVFKAAGQSPTAQAR
jgi:hypothetical protein